MVASWAPRRDLVDSDGISVPAEGFFALPGLRAAPKYFNRAANAWETLQGIPEPARSAAERLAAPESPDFRIWFVFQKPVDNNSETYCKEIN